ncbi:MAG: GWxTD domain-containing protein [Acidobacteria bacterium]|nr:MAG: GWxTD domain-containing protein [Acidobacteriota bacterium]
MFLFSTRRFPLLVIATAMLATPLLSQTSHNDRDAGTSLKDYKRDKSSKNVPEKKELTDQERKDRLRSFKREVSKTYQTWLDQDVRYIISREEEQAFKLLSNDEERDSFIEQFWLRRSPTPDTEANEFREEHYRRIQYANEHFAAGIPGWKTDRGHIYIVWGAPDEIESHPSGGSYQRDSSEGGGNTSTFPFERWRYRYLENIGNDVTIEFVDSCMCGDYHIALNPNEKDALLHTPGGGPTLSEEMGRGNRTNRIMGIDPGGSVKQFDALERYAKLTAPPSIKFKDLEEKVNTRIRYNLVPFDLRTDFVKLTSDTVLVPVTIQIKTRDMSFIQKQGIQQASVNIFGRISTLTGRVATTFEDTVTVNEPNDLFEKALLTSHLYWKAVSLRPGMYKIEVAIKDVNGDRVGTLARSLRVPEFEDEKLASSSLILADVMERLPAKSIGAGSFVIGDVKVRPRLDSADGKPASFKRSQRLNIWLQIYNLQQEQKTKKTQARISYDIINIQTNKSVFHAAESSDAYGKNSEQITLAKSMSLANMEPGFYSLKITVNDEVSKQTITPSARFQVE